MNRLCHNAFCVHVSVNQYSRIQISDQAAFSLWPLYNQSECLVLSRCLRDSQALCRSLYNQCSWSCSVTCFISVRKCHPELWYLAAACCSVATASCSLA